MMDHYATLDLTPAATKSDIKDAFRRHALRHHPDRHAASSPAGKAAAAVRFRRASEAYEVLADDRRRAAYDLSRRVVGTSPAARYGYGRGGGVGAYRAPPVRGGVGVDWGGLFRYLTGRQFLLNAVFASALFGGAIVLERSGDAIWKMNNSGKSFEEAIEKVKVQKE